MRLCDEARSYATVDNAIKALDKALARIGRQRGHLAGGPVAVRWLIAATSSGRFVPTVIPTDRDTADLIPLAHIGISVVR